MFELSLPGMKGFRLLHAVISALAVCVSGSIQIHGATYPVTAASDSGPGSLRQAILNANASPGLDSIVFNIAGTGVRTIALVNALPPITDQIVIDGTTQPGFAGNPVVELNGAALTTGSGLLLQAPGCRVEGLVINRFPNEGIRIEGPGTNVIQGNFIGTDASGSLGRGNHQGVMIYGAGGNLIGGTNLGDGNLVSGNKDVGIYAFNAPGNRISGNYIGTTRNGLALLGNTNHGVVLYNSAGNTVGEEGAGNVISGNRGSGVYLFGAASVENRLERNFIGADVGGTAALGNVDDGISLYFAGNNMIGGTNAASGNVISANRLSGISLAGSAAAFNLIQGNMLGTTGNGSAALGNGLAGITLSAGACSNWVGGAAAAARNIISGNKQDGVYLATNSVGNTVAGNFIGLNAAGKNALTNGFNGISFSQSHSNTIGGIEPGSGNVISGNGYYGVHLFAGSSGNWIAGNYIGTGQGGATVVSNRLSGIRIESPFNRVGGTAPGAANVISGNGQDGIYLVGGAATGNRMEGNFIGTTLGGSAPLGNTRLGIGISGAPRNVIGGTEPLAGNIISANGNSGIYLADRSAAWNEVLGNKIGTDSAGKTDFGNAFDGINCSGSVSNTFGSATPGGGNLISGNNNGGIYFSQSSWNAVQGNLIGTQIDGVSALGNAFSGVECDVGSTNNSVGGLLGEANRIAHSQNVYAGVRIRPGATRNLIRANSIFGNGGLGIDLGVTAGVTTNDNCDADGGANGLQNFPVLTEAVAGVGTRIRGNLNSAAARSYRLQFFATAAPDALGYGEGELFLGETTVVLGVSCSTDFSVMLPHTLPGGYFVSATATDNLNNTSEFSACVPVLPAPALTSAQAPGGIKLVWTATPEGFHLWQTGSLDPPVEWSAVTESPVLVDGRWELHVPAVPGTARFFVLRSE